MANPRGNPQNLVKNSERTPEERRERAAMMGKRSGEVRGQIKTFRETFRACTTQAEMVEMITAMKRQAMDGNVAAWKELRDLMGEKPSTDITNSDRSMRPFNAEERALQFHEMLKCLRERDGEGE